MKQFRILLLMMAVAFALNACGDDDLPCNGSCPTGFICVDDMCVEGEDPCEDVACVDGFVCENGDCVQEVTATTVVTGELTSNTTWTNDRIWELSNKVVVMPGATLTIEAGTIVKCREGSGSLATALIVARGAKIDACGTENEPIIFTSVLDNIQPGQIVGSNLSSSNNELWGGVIILGNAPISAKDGDTETQIEGIPADDTFGLFGGTNEGDDSGTLCFVSIRHGGALIGADNEINGLTLGGVGNGTSISNIEVVANLDDGIEFFGGTVNVKNVIVAYQGDDAIDIDMNYAGTLDNFVVIHGGSDTDEALEIDGPEGSTYTDGQFTLKNGLCIALDTENTSGADLKSLAQGTLENISWQGYDALVKIRASFETPDANTCTEKADAYTRARDGALIVKECEVEGNFTAADVAKVYIDSKADNADDQSNCLSDASAEYEAVVDGSVAANGNSVVESGSIPADLSEFSGWSWTSQKGLLDNL